MRQKGQAVIFLVLMFQVVFVVFTMVLNVGLLVHQKINLQNSVDLAAYYAAAKQAEYLNAIAHSNYQIRQSWKLLSFRYNALYTLPLNKPYNRVQGRGPAPQRGVPYQLINNLGENIFPTCLIADAYWYHENLGNDTNPCTRLQDTGYNIRVPPQVQITVGRTISRAVSALTRDIQIGVEGSCKYYGPFNWAVLAATYVAHKLDVMERRQQIEALFASLSRPYEEGDAVDMDRESIYQGARVTLEKNLTPSQNIEEFVVRNSMSDENCNTLDQAFAPIWTNANLWYVDFIYQGTGDPRDSANCSVSMNFLSPNASQPNTVPRHLDEYRTQVDPQNVLLGSLAHQEVGQPGKLQLMLGYEKNPWCQSYVEVSATTTARVAFLPFGRSMNLRAKAVAKPFGGRIGPWYYATWPSGSRQSQGSEDSRILRAEPNRVLNAGGGVGGPNVRQPNYTRFPGDELGVQEDAHLAALHQDIHLSFDRMRAEGNPQPKLQYRDYRFLDAEFYESGDALSYRHPLPVNQSHKVRILEMLAIRPDLFDISYYTILPQFTAYYREKLQGFLTVGGGGDLRVRPDMGGRLDRFPFPDFSVVDQYQSVDAQPALGQNTKGLGVYTTKWDQTLTGWISAFSHDYGMTQVQSRGLLGACRTPAGTSDNPLGCFQGARSGYSVKFVNPDMLKRSDLEFGGTGQTGPILNPPRL